MGSSSVITWRAFLRLRDLPGGAGGGLVLRLPGEWRRRAAERLRAGPGRRPLLQGLLPRRSRLRGARARLGVVPHHDAVELVPVVASGGGTLSGVPRRRLRRERERGGGLLGGGPGTLGGMDFKDTAESPRVTEALRHRHAGLHSIQGLLT